eukprot:1040691-Rhodomonas_salina.2
MHYHYETQPVSSPPIVCVRGAAVICGRSFRCLHGRVDERSQARWGDCLGARRRCRTLSATTSITLPDGACVSQPGSDCGMRCFALALRILLEYYAPTCGFAALR